jgi:transcriptional regulator with XRE-family HTH domain
VAQNLRMFADELITMRKVRKLSQRALAKRIGLKAGNFYRFETGDKDRINAVTMYRIAEGLDCELVIRLVPRITLRYPIRVDSNLISASVAIALEASHAKPPLFPPTHEQPPMPSDRRQWRAALFDWLTRSKKVS